MLELLSEQHQKQSVTNQTSHCLSPCAAAGEKVEPRKEGGVAGRCF